MAEDLDFDRGDALAAEAKALGAADGEVDDATANVGAAVIDGDDFGATVVLVGDAHFGAHWQSFVGGGGGVVG